MSGSSGPNSKRARADGASMVGKLKTRLAEGFSYATLAQQQKWLAMLMAATPVETLHSVEAEMKQARVLVDSESRWQSVLSATLLETIFEYLGERDLRALTPTCHRFHLGISKL